LDKHLSIPILLAPLLFSILGGCGTPAPKKFSSEMVRVYAELLALHEKEKISGSVPDSTYRREVREFFLAKKINEEDFQKQVIEISRDDVAWRDFLSKSIASLDSIKAARNAQH
jgi:hypothetical protein